MSLSIDELEKIIEQHFSPLNDLTKNPDDLKNALEKILDAIRKEDPYYYPEDSVDQLLNEVKFSGFSLSDVKNNILAEYSIDLYQKKHFKKTELYSILLKLNGFKFISRIDHSKKEIVDTLDDNKEKFIELALLYDIADGKQTRIDYIKKYISENDVDVILSKVMRELILKKEILDTELKELILFAIKSERLTDEIINLIESGHLNFTAPMFKEINLYQLALKNVNVTLLKYLYKKKQPNVNSLSDSIGSFDFLLSTFLSAEWKQPSKEENIKIIIQYLLDHGMLDKNELIKLALLSDASGNKCERINFIKKYFPDQDIEALIIEKTLELIKSRNTSSLPLSEGISDTQFKNIVSFAIQSERGTLEIINLIESGNLDLNDPIWKEFNLYHLALKNANYTLVKYLYENKKTDVNQLAFLDGYKYYPMDIIISFFEQSSSPESKKDSLKKTMRYLLDHTNIDVSLTTNKSFPPSMRLQFYDFKIATELLHKEPNSSKEKTKRVIKTTCLKFGLSWDGEIKFDSSRLGPNDKLINPEGSDRGSTVSELQISFEKYIKTIESSNIELEEKTILRKANAILQHSLLFTLTSYDYNFTGYENLLKKYKNGEPICLVCGTNAHCIAYVLHNDLLYYCNKGEFKQPKYGVAFYTIENPQDVTFDTLRDLTGEIRPEKVNSFDIKYQEEGLEGKSQYVGNCAMASPKKAIHAIIYDIVSHQYPEKTMDEKKQTARILYKKWAAWDREEQIKQLIDVSENDKELLVPFLRMILYTNRTNSKNHKKIISALLQSMGAELRQILTSDDLKSIGEKYMTTILKQKRPLGADLGNLKSIADNLTIDLYMLLPEKYHLFSAVLLNDVKKIEAIRKENNSIYLATYGTHNDAPKKMSILHFAVSNHKENSISLEFLLKQYPELINIRNEAGSTPLHIAIKECQVDVVKLLLEHGAELSDLHPSAISRSAINAPLSIDALFEDMSKHFSPDNEKLLKMKALIKAHREKYEPSSPAFVASGQANESEGETSQKIKKMIFSMERKKERHEDAASKSSPSVTKGTPKSDI